MIEKIHYTYLATNYLNTKTRKNPLLTSQKDAQKLPKSKEHVYVTPHCRQPLGNPKPLQKCKMLVHNSGKGRMKENQ